MKKYFILIFYSCFIQCNTSTHIDYDEELLNEGVLVFENHLKVVYGEMDEIKLYKNFLNDFSDMSFTRKFFTNKTTKNYLSKLIKTNTFKNLYKLYEEPEFEEEIYVTAPLEEVNEEELPDFYMFNEQSNFTAGLREKTVNEDFKEYWSMSIIAPDISPTVKSSAILVFIDKLKEEDFKLLKTSIAFDLYFSSMLMFSK